MSYWIDHNDLLGRGEEAEYLRLFLANAVYDKKRRRLVGSFVLNIDATWGQGKTFFMKGLFHEIKAAGHPVIMIDAWRDDFSDDPLTTVIAEFDNYLAEFKGESATVTKRVRSTAKILKRNLGKLLVSSAKGLGKKGVRYVVGESSDEVIALLKDVVAGTEVIDNALGQVAESATEMTDAAIDEYADRQLERFNEAKTSLINFKESLEKAVETLTAAGKQAPFFVLVDELDRCRPTYAIEMLERIKHLFEVQNVVFVLSTDTRQLANSIKVVYGSEFDSRHYLARFFDRTYMLAAPSRKTMIQYLYLAALIDDSKVTTRIGLDTVDLIDEVSRQFELEIRQIERAIDLLASIATVWPSKAPIELAIMFPMIVAFIKGNQLVTPTEVRDVFLVEPVANNPRGRYLNKHNLASIIGQFQGAAKNTIVDAIRQIEDHMDNRGSAALTEQERFLYEVLREEMQATGKPLERTAFSTYAGRIRMAGRFAEDERRET
jgi:hypothetical protein